MVCWFRPRASSASSSELAGDGRVLELGIGTGRVALPLAALGVAVEGIDASPSMVDGLRSKPGGEGIPVVIGDMATLEVAGAFRLVYVMLTRCSVLPPGPSGRLLPAGRCGARTGGSFLLECFVPDIGRFDRGPSFRTISIDDDVVRVDASLHDAATQQVTAH